jgi:hypothetical protein
MMTMMMLTKQVKVFLVLAVVVVVEMVFVLVE